MQIAHLLNPSSSPGIEPPRRSGRLDLILNPCENPEGLPPEVDQALNATRRSGQIVDKRRAGTPLGQRAATIRSKEHVGKQSNESVEGWNFVALKAPFFLPPPRKHNLEFHDESEKFTEAPRKRVRKEAWPANDTKEILLVDDDRIQQIEKGEATDWTLLDRAEPRLQAGPRLSNRMGRPSLFSEEQMIAILKECETEPVRKVCTRHQISPATYYAWKAKLIDMPERFRALEEENGRLKRLVADQAVEIQKLKDEKAKQW